MVTLKIRFSRVLKINAWEELNIFIKILTLYQRPFADFIFYLAFLCNHQESKTPPQALKYNPGAEEPQSAPRWCQGSQVSH